MTSAATGLRIGVDLGGTNLRIAAFRDGATPVLVRRETVGDDRGPAAVVARIAGLVEQVRAELAAWKRNPVTADGLRQVNGDPGWVYVGTGATGKTRALVQQELAEFRRNPVTADGLTFMAGEAGYIEAGIAQRTGAIARSTTPVTIGQRPLR